MAGTSYKVVDIYKDLPKRAACHDCGKPGCFAFATAAHLEGLPIERCPHLTKDQLQSMMHKMEKSRGGDTGPREGPEEQAAVLLQEKLASSDLAELARRGQVEHVPGPPEALRVELLGRSFLAGADDVFAEDQGEVDIWAKVVVLLYLTRATGVPTRGEWVAFRELPNTISKQITYEKWVDRIPKAYAGRFERLEEVAVGFGGVRATHDSADMAIRFQALPRVPLLLLVWDADADFEARGSLLLDAGVLDYLDQEALTFVAESLMRSLLA